MIKYLFVSFYLFSTCLNASGVSSIITNDALKVYYEYRYAKNNRAFAQSKNGTWAIVSNITSVELAKKMALERCNFHNKKNQYNQACKIINVNGHWKN